MKHLTDEQLSAVLDEALAPSARAEADAHLEQCEACRAALAELSSQEQVLAATMRHDPGDAYFEQFAGRVQERLAQEGAIADTPKRGARPGYAGLFGWLLPQRMAWVGAAAAVVVGAGLVFMVNREGVQAPMRDATLETRIGQVSRDQAGQDAGESQAADDDAFGNRPSDRVAQPGADAEAEFEERGPAADAEREPAARRTPSTDDERAGAPSAMKPAYRDEGGEELPVPAEPGFASAPETAPAPKTQGVQKPRARPLETQAQRETAKRLDPSPVAGAIEDKASVAREANDAKLEDAAAEVDRVVAKSRADLSEVADQAKGDTRKKSAERQAIPEGDPARSLAGAADVLKESGKTTGNVAKPLAIGETRKSVVQQAVGTARLCGTITDHAGRPVSGARVALAEEGRSTSTDRAGKYCLEAGIGDHTIAVMAVGFEAKRQSVTVQRSGATENLTLQAISVLELGRKVRGDVDAWPDSAQALARQAQSRSAMAARARSATLYDEAAKDWARVLKATRGGAPEQQARFAMAEARFRAWEIAPTEPRRTAARAALEAYLAKAPKSSDRDTAIKWLGRVKS